MRGPKPKPTRQKALDGNPGHRPLNDAEPRPPDVTPEFDEPPSEMAGNTLACAEWRRLAPMVRKLRLVTEADRSALIAVCLEWSRYIEATQKITTLGMVVKAPSGYPIVNPYLAIASRALVGCSKLWPELGMTPSGRSRVTTPGPDASTDAFAEFDQVEPLSTQH